MKKLLVGSGIAVLTLVSQMAGVASAQISPTTWYSIANRANNKCIDARAAATVNGTVIQQYACNNTNAQQFQFQTTTAGFVRINNRSNAAQVIDVSGVSLADNAGLHLWAYVSGNNQQWQAVAETGGFYRFVSRHSGKCLNVPNASTADSVQLAQFTCNGSTAQSFRLLTQAATPTPTPPNPGGRTMEIMTWVPSYNQNIWKTALQANTGGAWNPRNTLTRLGGQFWQVQSNGTLSQGVPDADVQWAVNYSNANGIKFLVCTHNYVNGWNWGIAASAFANNRTALINNLVAVVNRWGAAGVDIDFEGNLAGDPNRAEFATFIRELGARLHAMGKELTVDIFPYIWNQPSMNWVGDWVGSVDGIQSMGYDALYGGGPSWQAYRWQQDTVLAAGHRSYVFGMGMPGWTGTWGSGGLGSGVQAHVNELLSGNYNRLPTSVAIWDGQFNGAGWLSPGVWDGLHTLRTRQSN